MRIFIGGLALLCLGGCGGPRDVTVYKDLKTKYVATTDVREMSSEKLPLPPRGSALGVQTGLAGPVETVKTQLDGAALINGPIPFPGAEDVLASIRDQLLAKWPLQSLPSLPTIEVTASRQYTAESLSDDTIQISYGVLKRAKSDDELAFVVGHELGHLLLQHQLRRERTVNEARVATGVATTAAMFAVMFATGQRTGATLTLQAGPTVAAAGGAVAGNTAVAEILTTLVDPGWSSRQEEQADLIGIDLESAAGYNPSAATDAFDSIVIDAKAAADKAQEMRDQVSKQPTTQTKADSITGLFYAAYHSVDESLTKLRTNHPDPAKREDAAAKYRSAFYASEVTRPTRTEILDSLWKSRGFKNTGNAIEAAFEARAAIEQKDYSGALGAALKAQRLARSWWAPFYLGGVAFIEAGQTRRGLNTLLQATKMRGAPYPVYERTAMEYVIAGQIGNAMRIMDSADQIFGNAELTYPDRITLYRDANDKSQADAAFATCLKSGRSALRDACSSAENNPQPSLQPGAG